MHQWDARQDGSNFNKPLLMVTGNKAGSRESRFVTIFVILKSTH